MRAPEPWGSNSGRSNPRDCRVRPTALSRLLSAVVRRLPVAYRLGLPAEHHITCDDGAGEALHWYWREHFKHRYGGNAPKWRSLSLPERKLWAATEVKLAQAILNTQRKD